MSLEIVEKPAKLEQPSATESKETDAVDLHQPNEQQVEQVEETDEADAEEIDLAQNPDKTELGQATEFAGVEITQGDIMDSFGAVFDPDFQRNAVGIGGGIAVGETAAEFTRVASGTSGGAGLAVKGVTKGLVGGGLLWISSLMPTENGELSDAGKLFQIGAAASWGSWIGDVITFASGGSFTTSFGATSQFAASMGARIRAAQMSSQGQVSQSRQRQQSSANSTTQRQPSSQQGQESSEQQTSSTESGSSGFRRVQ